MKEEFWNLWTPIIFPWIPITLWLRQRFRILNFKDNYRGNVAFQLISWLIITALLCISQNYLTTASGKLEKLSNINEI